MGMSSSQLTKREGLFWPFPIGEYVEFSQVDYHKVMFWLSLWIRKMMINQDTLPSIVLFHIISR